MSPSKIKIVFYREENFEEKFNFFPCWGVRVYGSMSRLFDEEYEFGYFRVDDAKFTPTVVSNCKLMSRD